MLYNSIKCKVQSYLLILVFLPNLSSKILFYFFSIQNKIFFNHPIYEIYFNNSKILKMVRIQVVDGGVRTHSSINKQATNHSSFVPFVFLLTNFVFLINEYPQKEQRENRHTALLPKRHNVSLSLSLSLSLSVDITLTSKQTSIG